MSGSTFSSLTSADPSARSDPEIGSTLNFHFEPRDLDLPSPEVGSCSDAFSRSYGLPAQSDPSSVFIRLTPYLNLAISKLEGCTQEPLGISRSSFLEMKSSRSTRSIR